MQKVATFVDETTECRAEVYKMPGNRGLVRFFNHRGVHMDASDAATWTMDRAMVLAGRDEPTVRRVD